MRAEVVLVLLVDVVWEACQGYYEMDYSQNEDTDFYDTYDSDIGTTSLLTTTETESDVPARIRRFKPPDSTSNSEEQASNDFAPITPTLSSISELIVTRSHGYKDNDIRSLGPEEIEEIKGALRDILKSHVVEVETTPALDEDPTGYENFEDTTKLESSTIITVETSLLTVEIPGGIQWVPETISKVKAKEDRNKNIPLRVWQPSGKRIHAHREGGGAEVGEGPGGPEGPEGPEDKGPPKFDPDDYGPTDSTPDLSKLSKYFTTTPPTQKTYPTPGKRNFTITTTQPPSETTGGGGEGDDKGKAPVRPPSSTPSAGRSLSSPTVPNANTSVPMDKDTLNNLSSLIPPHLLDQAAKELLAKYMTTTTGKPMLDINAIIAIIANLTYDYEWNLTEQFNKTLFEHGVPTCPTPSTVSTTTTTPPQYDFANTSLVSKCFVCGLKTPEIPRRAYCSDAFAGDFLPLTPVDPRARGQIANFRKYCRFLDVHNYVENPSESRSIYGRFTGGCAVRWTDLSGIYTQRTCRNRYKPLMGKHFASKRMAKLELALINVENGCIISPMASLLALSRGISLYARFHACVCSTNWCNKAIRVQQWKFYWTMLLHWFFNR